MIARDERRVDRPHGGACAFGVAGFLGQPGAPARRPSIEGGGIREQRANAVASASVSHRWRNVSVKSASFVPMRVQQVRDQRGVALVAR